MADNRVAEGVGLVTVLALAGAVGLSYYAYTKTGPTLAGAALPMIGGFVVGGFVAGTAAGLVLPR